MENKIRVGITQGDMNGISYEIILKTLAEPTVLELFTPVIYGSPKVATFHRKALELNVNFTTVDRAEDVQDGRVNLVNCLGEEEKIDLGQATPESGKAAIQSLQCAVQDYMDGWIDVLVTTPVNVHVMQTDDFHFQTHLDYLEEEFGSEEEKALQILVKDQLRVALVTGHLPLKDVVSSITKETVKEKAKAFHYSLKHDFAVDNPRIAVLALNPHAGEENIMGMEETEKIQPAIQELRDSGIQCFGPFASEAFFTPEMMDKFDGVLAMYHDQALIPFRTLSAFGGVNYTAGLSIVRTAPVHGTGYDIAGKGLADESAFRNAIYTAMDIFRHRNSDDYAHRNPLRKTYMSKRDDSDKLKLDQDND